jgi:hypothetical protein
MWRPRRGRKWQGDAGVQGDASVHIECAVCGANALGYYLLKSNLGPLRALSRGSKI